MVSAPVLPTLPDLPTDLPGLDPAWSRVVEAPDAEGVTRRWHVLDTHAPDAEPDRSVKESDRSVKGTMLCVHGNPTWSYLWRRFLAQARPGWRVVAVDQLGMGYSEDPEGTLAEPRRLHQRVDDLTHLTDALDLTGPIVAVGHDWGGIVVAGWARRHLDRLAGLVLANTAVHHDFSGGLPAALRVARHPALIKAACVDTPGFVTGATAVSTPRPPADVRRAYAAPYAGAAARSFVGQFVADIPAEDDHPSRVMFEEVAAGLAAMGEVPALLLRGPADPVFSEEHLRDLRRRLPQADVHRYEGASHLVVEDAPRAAGDVWDWVADRVEAPAEPVTAPPAPDLAVGTSQVPWQRLLDAARETPDEVCVTEMRGGRSVTFAELEADIARTAAGLAAVGVRAGQRVALLVPPGIDLTVAVYACWRLGAIIVVADAGLGLASMGRALRGAGPDHVIAIPKAVAAAAALRVPGSRIVAGSLPGPARRALGVTHSLEEVRRLGVDLPPVEGVTAGDRECAILFTSGATGPSKGVVYRVDALRTMIGLVGHIYDLRPGDRLVAAFAPFALYGPALGIGAVTPDMDVTAPGTLTAAALADAILAADATVVFASPAALRNVVRTADALDDRQRAAMGQVRAVMSAGAPVPASLLRAVREVMPAASPHTPYGMTEVLPVADIELDEIEAAGPGDGVCVGRPLPGVRVEIAPLPRDPAEPDGPLTSEPGVMGEICVRAAHVKDRYDQLWATQRASADLPGWHRSGDVGHLDAEGRMWVQGRRVHVVHTADGPVTPVRLEQDAAALPGVESATVAGVGPVGTQQVVVVLVLEPGLARRFRGPLAPASLTARVREVAAGLAVAAVLVAPEVPVDIRHQSKVDRTAVSAWAARVLAGERGGRL